MRVAVIGLGTMGRAVATRLLDAGHDVVVWNRTADRTRPVVERGARPAPSPREAASGAGVAIVDVTDDDAVRAVALGDAGAAAGLDDDAVLVDMSTVLPATSRDLAGHLGEERFVDAPILGGPQAVVDRQARLFIGGEDETVERLVPLWQDLCAGYTHVGAAGMGTTMKLVSNLLLMGGLAVLAEAVAVAESAGVDTDTLRRLLGESAMLAPGLRNRLDDVVSGDHNGWFTTGMGRKDVRLARSLGAGARLDVAAAVEGLYAAAAEGGFADADIAAVVEVARGRA